MDEKTRAATLAEAEAKLHQEDFDYSKDLSIGDWIDRVRTIVQQAQPQARAGEVELERETWLDAASVCLARAALLAEVPDGES